MVVDAVLIVFAVTAWRVLDSRQRTRLRMRCEHRRRRTDQRRIEAVTASALRKC